MREGHTIGVGLTLSLSTPLRLQCPSWAPEAREAFLPPSSAEMLTETLLGPRGSKIYLLIFYFFLGVGT